MARMQRRGSRPRPIPGPKLFVDYKDLTNMVRFLGPQGQVLSRKRTGFNTQQQRTLKKAVKRARHVGLLPFVG